MPESGAGFWYVAPMEFPQQADLASSLELSRSALAANVAVFRALNAGSPRRLGAVLKGNAYGHGFEPMLGLLHPLVDALYVIAPGEGLAIRRLERERGLPRREVLVIGAVSAEEAVALAREGVDAVLADGGWQPHVAALRAAKLTLRVHVHLDTGLGREGFTLAQLAKGEARVLADGRDALEVAGVMTHFANTEDVTEQTYAQAQLDAYQKGFAALKAVVPLEGVQRHMAASAAALVLPPARQDVLRVGIAMYGLWPSAETRLSARVVLGHVPALRPVLAWRCPSQVVKWLEAGSSVGYGCTYKCPAPTRVAVLPVGYFDGYPRLLSGRAHVLVNGHRCKVLGRVMMNHLIVDVTHAAGDERPVVATLLGRDGEEALPAEQLATWGDTIHYELVTRIGAHLARRVVE